MGGKITKSDSKFSVIKSNFNGPQSKKSTTNNANFNDRNNKKKPKVVNKVNETNESNVLNLIRAKNENLEDLTLLENAISSNFFLKSLSKESMIEIIRKMELYWVNEDDVLFREGTTGNYFYIIQEGMVELSIKDKVIKTLSRGESFGELALLHDAMRSGTIKALKKCFFYCIERKNFRNIIKEINNLNYEENKNFLQSISILNSLVNDQKNILISNLNKENYEESKCIFKEGDVGSCLYYIKEGEVNCINKENLIIRTLKKGDYFGQQAILMDIPRTMTVIAKTTCLLLSISIETIKTMFGDKFREVLILNFIKHVFANSKFFMNIDLKFIENFFDNFKISKYDKNMVVLKKGYVCNSKILILIEGNLVNVNLY